MNQYNKTGRISTQTSSVNLSSLPYITHSSTKQTKSSYPETARISIIQQTKIQSPSAILHPRSWLDGRRATCSPQHDCNRRGRGAPDRRLRNWTFQRPRAAGQVCLPSRPDCHSKVTTIPKFDDLRLRSVSLERGKLDVLRNVLLSCGRDVYIGYPTLQS